jgi:hypothetical protein
MWVNIMTPKSRAYYRLEKKWQDGEPVGVKKWLIEQYEERKQNTGVPDPEDPFWS